LIGKYSNCKSVNNFVIKNLGPDPDWIRIQQQLGTRSGFSKIPGSGYGFSEFGSKHKKYELLGTGYSTGTSNEYENDKFATPVLIFQPGNVCIVLLKAGLLAATLGKLLRYPFLLPISEFYVSSVAYCGSDSYSLLVKFSNSKNYYLVHWTAKPKPLRN
jgi:hypothetical protein